MRRKYPVYEGVNQIVITEDLKTEVSKRLGSISTDTLLGIAYRNFIENISVKSNGDFQELLSGMFSEIQQNPTVIKKVLGVNFDFFSRLLLNYRISQKIHTA